MINASTAQVADLFNVTPRTVNAWGARGCPKSGRGRWDLKNVFNWWWENIGEERASGLTGDESINEAKRKFWWSKAQNETLKVEIAKGTRVPWSKIDPVWAGRVMELCGGLESLADRVPPLVVGKPLNDMGNIIQAEIRDLVKNYSRPGRYTPSLPEKKKGAMP